MEITEITEKLAKISSPNGGQSIGTESCRVEQVPMSNRRARIRKTR
jgi:hypothetical protein